MKPAHFTRRRFLTGSAVLLAAPPLLAAPTSVEVWKSPQCGCCKDWVTHVQAAGFAVQVRDDDNTDARAKLGMPLRYGSCHTARVDGYAIEGHVPAREIRRLLREQPKAIGLAVPAMPIGSPGMDAPAYGGRRDPYDILLVLPDGASRIFQHYA